MDEDTAARLVRLAQVVGDVDVNELLDAVLLAAAWSHTDSGNAGSTSAGVADDATQRRKQSQSDTAALATRTAAEDTAHPPQEPAVSVWLENQAGTHIVPGERANVGRAAALPDALDIGRALRPLRRPWLAGVRQRLDVDSTVEHYTRTGVLVPRLTPAPEPWLEVVVVLDSGTAMAVWDDTVRTLTRTLRALSAFRDVRVWHLEHPPGEISVLRDHQGHTLAMDPAIADHTQPARRLLLLVTDCAAPAWRQNALWRTVHTWGRTAPVALINPLPKRLWQRSGLDLPRTTASATAPASPGRLLSYRRPRLLRDTPDTQPWQALPVLQFHPAQILAWSRTLMRTDPSGCEAVLIPATGRPPRRQRPGVAVYPDTPPTSYEQVHARTIAFTDDRESHAVRLALAAAPLGSFTLSVLHVLRERLVPEAALADIAEFLTAGLLTAISGDSDEPIYHFHPAAADHLESLLTRDQLWDTHFALSDHLESHLQTPHGIPVVLHSPHAEDTLAASARPIARAAVTTARLLGVEPTDSLPADTRRRPSTEHTADFSSKADGSTASTSSTLDDSLPTTSVAPVDGTAQERTVISITIDQFGRYNDPLTRHARQATYRVLEDAFLRCDITPELLIWHDIGDGVLVVADSRVSHEHLLGRWLTRVHQYLQEKNAESQDTLRLRIGISAGSDINLGDIPIGSTVSLAVRLSESIIARQLLEAEDAYLVVAITENIYINGVRDGHGYIDHELYAPSLLELKEGTTHAWFHVPGRTAPRIPSTWLLRQRPEGLAAVTRDLTHALGDIERALTEGFYPNLPSSRRTAYLLRVVADQLAGDDTGENVIMEQQPLPHDPHDEVPLTQDPLTEAVISACENLIGNEIGNAQTDGDWTLNGIDLPLGMHNLTLHDVTPNIASISWDIVEEYEYDLTLGQVTVEVELILEGYMNKGDAFIDSSVRILEDINSHMVEVSIERSAQLIFDARRESGIFELEFHGTSAPELNPHEPK